MAGESGMVPVEGDQRDPSLAFTTCLRCFDGVVACLLRTDGQTD